MTDVQLRALEDLLVQLPVRELHHGDCTGTDKEAHAAARGLGIRIVIHPPEDTSRKANCIGDEIRRAKPYLERNHDIVDETDFLIACPRGRREELRSGTWATIRYARKMQRVIYLVWNDGSYSREDWAAGE